MVHPECWVFRATPHIYKSFISTVVTAHGQTLSSPLTYYLCRVFSLAISTPMWGAYWFIYPF